MFDRVLNTPLKFKLYWKERSLSTFSQSFLNQFFKSLSEQFNYKGIIFAVHRAAKIVIQVKNITIFIKLILEIQIIQVYQIWKQNNLRCQCIVRWSF